MKKLKLLVLTMVLALLCVPVVALAAEFKSEQSYTLPENEVVSDDLFVSGQAITIDGTIDGDLFAAGTNVKINGTVKGSVFAGGQTVTINGSIGNDLYAGAATVEINGNVADNVYLGSGNINSGNKFKVGRDLFLGAGAADIKGVIGRNLVGGAGSMIIDGMVNGSAYLEVGDENAEVKYGEKTQAGGLVLEKNAKIKDNLEYKGNQKAEMKAGSFIGGKTDFKQYQPKVTADEEQTKAKQKGFSMFKFVKGTISFIGFIIVCLIFVAIFKRHARDITETLRKSYGRSIGIGVLTLFVMPIVVIGLAMTLVGIPLAFIAGMVYILLLYFSKVVFSLFLGEVILRNLVKKRTYSIYVEVLLGAVIVSALIALPFFGFLIKLVVMVFGLGAIAVYVFNKRKNPVKNQKKIQAKKATDKVSRKK